MEYKNIEIFNNTKQNKIKLQDSHQHSKNK